MGRHAVYDGNGLCSFCVVQCTQLDHVPVLAMGRHAVYDDNGLCSFCDYSVHNLTTYRYLQWQDTLFMTATGCVVFVTTVYTT